jgi:hypothetical protein
MKKRSIINILTYFCKCTMFFNVIDISRLAGQPMIVEYINGHTKNAIEIV